MFKCRCRDKTNKSGVGGALIVRSKKLQSTYDCDRDHNIIKYIFGIGRNTLG